MRGGAWFNPAMAVAACCFLIVGMWDYAVSGAYKLIVIGTLVLGFLVLAERQRRAFASKSQPEQE